MATIVGLGGSLARASKSRAALLRALEGAAAAGAETRLLDLRELDLPMYNPDDDKPGEAAAEIIESCYEADGLIWSSALYQGTISGALKNALDWLHLLGQRDPPYLHDKVIGLISAAGGTQGLQAINTTEFAVRALRGWASRRSSRSLRQPGYLKRQAGSKASRSRPSLQRLVVRLSASPSGSRRIFLFTASMSAQGRQKRWRPPASSSDATRR
jgi:NAD(P)H-dependent FMN reductase